MTETEIPEDHPRYASLVTRHRIEAGVENGITSKQGLIAQGRGESFDYLLGERTLPSADAAARAAAATLLLADHPVVSVNGNVAALAPEETVELAEAVDADIEVNLFNHTDERVRRIADHLRDHGAEEVKGLAADGEIPGLDHARGTVDADGIEAADVVVVPLEDGDRAEALDAMGKTEIVIDLNPGSRSPRTADIPIVDNLIRAVPSVTAHARALAEAGPGAQRDAIDAFDADDALAKAEAAIREGSFGAETEPAGGGVSDGAAQNGENPVDESAR
ncbi:4-phosphopantoate--beta-alanine ligase [Halorubrum halophilum]|uniref:4-phosphopantoate--beta-alanine ligase n=1 Tax=Halorubrum halophilum TaxID=413816 RepID=UPI001D0085F7|nr:4-phosphopantoate--beta-alanine ligase [Halorubrum halophilum]